MTTEIFKCYKISKLFDAQKSGNGISKLLDFKFFWEGDMPPDPLVVLATYYTFSGRS